MKVFETGVLDAELNDGHVMRMYRRREVERAARTASLPASGHLRGELLLGRTRDGLRAGCALARDRLAACREPGALDGGTHMVVSLEKT